jgi:sporulation protein YlmC with PRC-barrel domain
MFDEIEAERMGGAIPRNSLIGMQVYMPNAKYVGAIKDLTFVPGETKATLIVEARPGNSIEVDWMDVKAVGDIILLKKELENIELMPVHVPAQTEDIDPKPPSKPSKNEEQINCPDCSKPAVWIEKYSRWYCSNCKKYI